MSPTPCIRDRQIGLVLQYNFNLHFSYQYQSRQRPSWRPWESNPNLQRNSQGMHRSPIQFQQVTLWISFEKRYQRCVLCLTVTLVEPLGPIYNDVQLSRITKVWMCSYKPLSMSFFPQYLDFWFMLPYCSAFMATIIDSLSSLGPQAP